MNKIVFYQWSGITWAKWTDNRYYHPQLTNPITIPEIKDKDTLKRCNFKLEIIYE